MRNIKMVIEYDGSAYYGWQRQKEHFLTVQQVLEERVEAMTGERVVVISSGRTDAGVHALNQVVNFRTETKIPSGKFLLGMNSLLPSDIVVKSVEDVDEAFHARYSARSKKYLYLIFNSSIRSALYRNHAWFIHDDLDLDAMAEAASMLKGRHDFSSFCAADNTCRTYEREIFEAGLNRDGKDMIHFSIEASGFLKYMVRNIVGTLVYVGKGKLAPSSFGSILDSRDRRLAGPTAPPQGLYLKEVRY